MHIQKTSSDFKIAQGYKDSEGDGCDKVIDMNIDYESGRFSLSQGNPEGTGGATFNFDRCPFHSISEMKALAKCISRAIDIAEKELNQK